MLLQLLAQHPEAIGTVLRSTPTWVWGLFAGLLALGLSQVRGRRASLARVSIMPVAMTIFSAWGTLTAFGSSPLLPQLLAAWIVAAGLLVALIAPARAAASYDPVTRTYAIPGSVVPLLLIVCIFLVKYVVGVDLAMAPQLLRDSSYALTVAALYGAITGTFVGRAMRLWKLALRRATIAVV